MNKKNKDFKKKGSKSFMKALEEIKSNYKEKKNYSSTSISDSLNEEVKKKLLSISNKNITNKTNNKIRQNRQEIEEVIFRKIFNFSKHNGFVTEKKIKIIIQQHIGKVRQQYLNHFYRYLEKNNIKIQYTQDKTLFKKKEFINILNLFIEKGQLDFSQSHKDLLEQYGPVTKDIYSKKYFTTSKKAYKEIHNELKKWMTLHYDEKLGKIIIPFNSLKKENSSRISSNMPSLKENNDIDNKKHDIEKYFKGIYKNSNVVSVKKSKILNSSVKEIDELLKFKPKSKNNPNIEAFIGFDFGTTSSKIIINFPYSKDFLGFKYLVFPVLEPFRCDDDPFLWKTIIYYNEISDEYSLYPQEGYEEINDIKTNLIDNPNNLIKEIGQTKILSMHASVAYISLLIKLVKGYCYKKTQKNHIQWNLNLGMPAETLDDKKLKNLYENIAYISMQINEFPITNAQINSLIKNSYLLKVRPLENICITPEIVAAIEGIKKSTMLESEEYLIVDIGGSTLDLSIINIFYDNEDNPKSSNLISKVHLLGGEATSWLKKEDGYSINDLLEAIISAFGNIVTNNKKKRNPLSRSFGNKLRMITVGGGKKSAVHILAINKVEKNWKKNFFPNGLEKIEIKFDTINFSEDYRENEVLNDEDRLTVAYGLSIEPYQYAKYTPQSEIEDIDVTPKVRDDYKFPSEK